MVGQAKRRATQVRPKAVGGAILGHFLNFDKSRLKEAGDVISGRIMGSYVPDDRAKFGDPSNNLSREIAHEAVKGGIFDGFFAVTCDRK